MGKQTAATLSDGHPETGVRVAGGGDSHAPGDRIDEGRAGWFRERICCNGFSRISFSGMLYVVHVVS